MKKLITLALTGAVLLSSQAVGFAGINIEVNGKNVPFDVNNGLGVPFVDENNRTLVPFRIAMEFAGATVDWNNETRTAIAMKDGIKVEAPIGKNYIYKDGVKEIIDTQAVIKDGRTYLPIRAVLEALEYKISWEQETQTVVAESEGDVEEVLAEEEVFEEVIPNVEKVLTKESDMNAVFENYQEETGEYIDIQKIIVKTEPTYTFSIKENNGYKFIVTQNNEFEDQVILLKNGMLIERTPDIYSPNEGVTYHTFTIDITKVDRFAIFNFENDTMIIVPNPFKE